MICLIALAVFGVLGIFSAAYRKLAKEALECVFLTVTLRKCESGLDQRIKSALTGKMMARSPKVAGFLYRYFEWLSWVFVILMVLSLGYAAYGGYNYYKYGNCNGPESTGFCIFDPSGGDSQYAGIKTGYSGEMIWPSIGSSPLRGQKDAPLTIIEFGCYRCPYSKKADQTVQQLLKEYDGKINFVFKAFPLTKTHGLAKEAALASECAEEQGKFWEYHDALFAQQETIRTAADLSAAAAGLGMDIGKFDACTSSEKYAAEVDAEFEEGVKAGVYGTPTFFIGKKAIVGPKPIEEFRKAIDKELAKRGG